MAKEKKLISNPVYFIIQIDRYFEIHVSRYHEFVDIKYESPPKRKKFKNRFSLLSININNKIIILLLLLLLLYLFFH